MRAGDFFGTAEHVFSTTSGGGWDAAVITRYPTPRAIAEFWLDQEFIEAHGSRVDGVDESTVVVLSPMRGVGRRA